MRAGWKRGAICECYWVCALPKGINLYIPSYFWESRTSDYPVQVDHNPERCWNFWMKRLDFGCEVDLILIWHIDPMSGQDLRLMSGKVLFVSGCGWCGMWPYVADRLSHCYADSKMFACQCRILGRYSSSSSRCEVCPRLRNDCIASTYFDNISMNCSASFWASSSPVGIVFGVEETRHRKAFDVNRANCLVWKVDPERDGRHACVRRLGQLSHSYLDTQVRCGRYFWRISDSSVFSVLAASFRVDCYHYSPALEL